MKNYMSIKCFNGYIIQVSEMLMRLEGHAEYAAVWHVNLLLFDYGWQIYVVNQFIQNSVIYTPKLDLDVKSFRARFHQGDIYEIVCFLIPSDLVRISAGMFSVFRYDSSGFLIHVSGFLPVLAQSAVSWQIV